MPALKQSNIKMSSQYLTQRCYLINVQPLSCSSFLFKLNPVKTPNHKSSKRYFQVIQEAKLTTLLVQYIDGIISNTKIQFVSIVKRIYLKIENYSLNLQPSC
jgi:hypothetical protein